jgi:23S rRNA (cytosine1962-C5)-methyltransferase
LPLAWHLSAPELRRLLGQAVARRASLAESGDTTAYRVVNGDGDRLPGMTVDRFAHVTVLSLYDGADPSDERRLAAALAETIGARSVYLKRRPREARRAATLQKEDLAPVAPTVGQAVGELAVVENGRRHLIRPGGDLSVGLFLDMRDARRWVRDQARGRTVLNTFAYTCAFGVAALSGGASRALNLDLSRRVLDWGVENYRLNGMEAERRDFVSGDVFDWLGRLGRRGERFDLVILDPPSFATSRGQRFSAASDYDRLVSTAAAVVAEGGTLLCACNLAGLSRRAFGAAVKRGLAAARRPGLLAATLGQSPLDFPVPEGEEPPLKVMALELDR